MMDVRFIGLIFSVFPGESARPEVNDMFVTCYLIHLKLYCLKGNKLYVLTKHHKMSKFANLSGPSNNTFCSCAPGRATEEQAEHTHAESVKHLIIIIHRYPGKKTLYIRPMMQVTIESVLRKSDSFGLHIL
jgi:hypothetical protein